MIVVVVLFFLQEEEDIRDSSVSGVQTCALNLTAAFDVMLPAEIHQSRMPFEQIAQTAPTPLTPGPEAAIPSGHPALPNPSSANGIATSSALSTRIAGHPVRPGSPNLRQQVQSFGDLGAQTP